MFEIEEIQPAKGVPVPPARLLRLIQGVSTGGDRGFIFHLYHSEFG
jgi:hypothetical protein